MGSPFSFLKKIFDDSISPAEQLERIMALLEAVRLSDEVTGRLGSIF